MYGYGYGYGGFGGCGSYGYGGGCGCYGYGRGCCNWFPLIVVLFILLIIIGCVCWC